jgi:restriction endonuclease S subunit
MQTSIVNYQNLNFELRIDAEYYRAEVLEKAHLLDKKNNDILENLASFVIGPFGSTVTVDKYVSSSDFRYVRNKDINDFEIRDDDPAYIPEHVYKTLPQFHIKENDLLITVVGTLGKVAIATKKDTRSIFSCKSTIIRAKKIDPFFLLAYLNTNAGQIFALRGVRGAIQQGLNLSDLKEIKVFIPSKNFQKIIRSFVFKAIVANAEARNLYTQAEKILLSELNLLNWKPKRQLSFVKKYSDTQTASRIDAEYFQPMYEEIENIINNYNRGFDRVGKQFRQNKKSLKRIPDKDYKYIEISCVNISDGSMQPLILMGDELPANAKINFSYNDVIVSKVRPYRGAIGIVTSNNYVGSGAFTVLQENGVINKETLFIFLRSKPMLEYSLKFNTGTSYPTITDNDILDFPLPLIDETKQKQIKAIVKEGIKVKYISKQLLDIAKRGVELAIEKDEKTAQEWIDSKLKNLNIKL